jgi:phosphate-selective porin OprO/OprP
VEVFVVRRSLACQVAALVLTVTCSAAAQEPKPPATQLCGGEPSGAPAVVRFDEHLSVCFGHLAKVEFLGKFQFDSLESDAFPDVAAFDVNHARIGTRGVLFDRIGYEIERELNDREQPWRDAFVNVRATRALEFRGGRFKVPFGVEQLVSIMDLDLAHRSAASSYLTPGREVGVSVHGRLVGKTLRYETGVFRNGGDNVRSSERDDPRGAPTFAARLTASPWKRPATAAALKGLTFGAGLTSGVVPEGPNSLAAKTIVDDPIFNRVHVDGRRRRLGADVEWSNGPIAIRAEHILVSDERRGQGTDDNDLPEARAQGGHVGGSWLLTGEKNDGNITPRHPVTSGGIGAIEVAARLEWLSFGSASGDEPSSSPRSAHILRQAQTAFTVGINWYVNRFGRVQTNVIRTVRSEGGVPLPGGDTWASIIRLQVGL